MKKSKIQWTDTVWNPTTGCTKVSAGCKNCYAERMAKRLKAMGNPRYKDGFNLALHDDLIEAPLHWRKPRMVFVNSMSDLFHEDVPFEFIDKVFAVMALCPRHTFQILTKRAERMREYLRTFDEWGDSPDKKLSALELALSNTGAMDDGIAMGGISWPIPNVWLGVSVEDGQQYARLDALKETPAAVRFISYEPALELVDSRCYAKGIHWLIMGGESGPGARPLHLEWVRDTIGWCRGINLPLFVKQVGSNAWLDGKRFKTKHPKGGDMAEWPEDWRVREMPNPK